MRFRFRILTSICSCPMLLLGCGTVGTYYPKSSTPPAAVSQAKRIGRPKSQESPKLSRPVADRAEAVSETKTASAEVTEPRSSDELSVEILPITFEDQSEQVQDTSYDGEPADVPLPEPAGDIQTLNANSMSLEELESIALANNPAIKELAATTQKAAGYRTQVGGGKMKRPDDHCFLYDQTVRFSESVSSSGRQRQGCIPTWNSGRKSAAGC